MVNWRRGLFRLWLVAAVLWIAFVLSISDTVEAAGSYLSGESMRFGFGVSASELSISTMNDGRVTVTVDGRIYEIDPSGVSPTDSDEWARILDAAALKMNQDAAINNADRTLARAATLNGIKLATLPPFFVLVLGASLLWALYGFGGGSRQRKH